MTTVASEVLVAGTGALYKAPLGTTAPATHAAALDAAFENLGYFTSDGVPINFADSVDNIVAWQSAQVVRATRTETLTTLSFTPIQTRGSVLEAFHAGSVLTEPSADEYLMNIVPAVADPSAWIFDAFDGTKRMRWSIPNGEITERGEIMHANGSPIGYPMTITFYPDDNGNLATLLSNIVALEQGTAL